MLEADEMTEHSNDAQLNEFDKYEWLLIARKLAPYMTESEYDKMWEEFVAGKAEYQRQKGLQ